MAATKSRARSNGKPARLRSPAPQAVLTLSEAAAYLRVTPKQLDGQAEAQRIPGRRVAGQWRFLRSALDDWLRCASNASGNDAFLALAGAWKDDPDLPEIVADAYRRRGRPSIEETP